jgi:hypothetical protein
LNSRCRSGYSQGKYATTLCKSRASVATRSIEDAYKEYRELQKLEPISEDKQQDDQVNEPKNTPMVEPEEIPQVKSPVEPDDAPQNIPIVDESEHTPADDLEHRSWLWGIRRKLNTTNKL